MKFLMGAIGFDLMVRARQSSSIAGQTVTIAGTDFITVNLGQVVLDDLVLCSFTMLGTKGATEGLNALNLRKGAPSTCSLDFAGGFDAFADFFQVNAGDSVNIFRTAFGRITASGTLHLFVNATSLGSDTTGASFAMQAWVLRGS